MGEPDRPLAVVTGTTGGIGGALAPMLSEAGWDLALPVRGPTRIAPLVEAIERGTPAARVATYDADLSRHDDLRALAETVSRDHSAVGALINVAGYLSPVHEKSAQGNDPNLELNALGPLLLTHLLAPALARGADRHGRAVVVNVSSQAIGLSGPLDVAGLRAPRKPGIFGAYGQTKLALSVATQELAPIYVPSGIDLYAIDPGSNRSAMTKGPGAPFFVRWMSRFLPGPETGARRLMVPLAPNAGLPTGSLVVGGKAKLLPKQAGPTKTAEHLIALLSERTGVDLTRPELPGHAA